MINDNTARLFFPEGEVRELASPQGLFWERELLESKARGESAYVTRNNGIKGLKAFGATPVKHKAEALWGRYVPCEYVQGTGTQYIDTGIKITSDDEVYLDGCATTTTTAFLLSQGLSADNQAYQIASTSAHGLIFDISSNVYRVNTEVSAVNTIRKIHIKNREIFVDGVSKGTSTGTLTNPTSTAKLMYSAPQSEAHRVKIVRFTVVGKCDLVAVKDVVSNVYGMYDRVSGKFYGNAGTGAFSGGELIQPIFYAESTGTQYVDTGVKFKTLSDELDLDFEFVSFNSSCNRVFGTTSTYTGMRLNYESVASIFYTEIKSKPLGTVGLTAALNTRYKIEFNKNGKLFVNGVDYGSYEEQVAETSDSIYLFGYHGIDAYSSLKVYGSKFIRNGEIIRNYLPVRIGTTVELLDLVSWSFATRVGTLIAGQDIPYSQLVPDIIKVNTGDLAYGVGKNLFDENAVSLGYRNDNGVLQPSTASTISEYIDCEPNTTYTIKTTALQGGGYLRVHQFNSDKIWISMLCKGNAGEGTRTFTFTTSSTAKYLTISGYITGTYGEETQLEVGSQATPYEPYAKTIRTNGTHKVIVGSQGVVDLGTLKWSKTSTQQGVWSANHIVGKADGITNILVIGTNYSLTDASSIRYMANMTYKGHATSDNIYIRDDDAYDNMTAAEFKAAMSGVMLYYQRTTDSAFVAPQVRDIPMLFSTDSLVDLQSGVKTEKWAVKVFDGTENFSWNATYNRFGLSGLDEEGQTYLEGICTHYEVKSTTVEENDFCFSWSSSGTLHWKDSRFNNDISGMKAYLASEYAKGTPVIILYPLATPVTEQVTIAPVTSARRTTYVADSDSELGKTSIELDFLGKFGTLLNFITSDNKNFITSDNKQLKVQL